MPARRESKFNALKYYGQFHSAIDSAGPAWLNSYRLCWCCNYVFIAYHDGGFATGCAEPIGPAPPSTSAAWETALPPGWYINPSVDSYPARLQKLLGANLDVLNDGLSGATLLKQGDTPYWGTPTWRQSYGR